MTWTYEYAVDTTAASELLWRHWSAVESWPRWNAGIRSISIDGPFAVGTRFTMTPPDDEPVEMTITDISPGRAFTDEMDGGDFVVRTLHRLDPGPGGGTRVTYRTEIDGPAADVVGPQIGPAITADFPDVLAALVSLAEEDGDGLFSTSADGGSGHEIADHRVGQQASALSEHRST